MTRTVLTFLRLLNARCGCAVVRIVCEVPVYLMQHSVITNNHIAPR